MVTITNTTVRKIRELYASGLSLRQIAAIVGVHNRTVEKYRTEESERLERNRKRETNAPPVDPGEWKNDKDKYLIVDGVRTNIIRGSLEHYQLEKRIRGQ